MAVKRLVEAFVPEHYEIFVEVDRSSRLITGRVSVTGEALSPNIALHQKDLSVTAVTADGVAVPYAVDDAAQEVAVTLATAGPVTIATDYTAPLTDNMMGIYPCYYSVDGVKKELVGTQFESHFARQAFPCVDEPEAKATFELSVKWDEQPGEMIISNTPEVSCDGGVHRFERTLKMSSYLLAFVFGELQAKYGKTKSGVEVGTFATKAHPTAALDFPLEIAIASIDFYEAYYKTPYPLAHSYHVALPDFSAGAMENWGCITYREVCMLVDPENATEASKQYVGTVIAHELAHQWFGDLVTMKWWDDLWLNESFAENMMHLSIDAIHPEWHIWNSFAANEANMALDRDATDGVQSVHVEVTHPDEINTLFDPAIVYAKGARLMTMLRKWLGDVDFSEGLHQYFEANQYSNTTGDDLWAALSAVSGKDVGAFMHSWINQPGYPVVTATVTADGALRLSQEQFFIGEHEKAGRLWQVPLNSNNAALPDILSQASVTLADVALATDQPLLLNEDNAAHYIVNYEGVLLETILTHLSALSDIEKFQVLEDRIKLAKAGVIDFADVIALLPYYVGEESYIVNLAINQLFSELKIFFDEGTEAEKAYQSLISETFAKQYARLGWDRQAGESSDDESLRALILAKMTAAGQAGAVARSRALFAAHAESPEGLSADVRPIVLATEIRESQSESLVRDFVRRYQATAISEYKDELAAAVSYIKSGDAHQELLDGLKDASKVKPQDLSHWYFNLVTKDASCDAAWDWVKANWSFLADKLGGDMSFDHFVVYTARAFKTAAQLEDFKAFFEPKMSELGLKRNIVLGISNIASRVALIDKQKTAVEAAVRELTESL